ncbi:hypothetical protein DPMN_070850 [Dreissena polymorpha]|uniref:Uncharacterized protein n=1 Tax=Dreissena polymorpha TaxID=45954 RepID=A0A9D3Z1R9_DREPO|nr:hypothetical protein DPMN_070850 [Dreissena polymorpha]
MAGPMPVSDMRGLETWEDFLNVQSEEYKDAHGSLHFQIGIISKFMRWYRRASVLPSHAQTSTGPQIPDRATILEMLESQGAERDREHSKGEAIDLTIYHSECSLCSPHRLIRDDTCHLNWIYAKKRLPLNKKYHKS